MMIIIIITDCGGYNEGSKQWVAWQYFGDLHIFGRNFICAERFRMMNKFLAALSG
jgi:hypothetical protein